MAADLCGSRRARQRLGGQFEEAALVGAAELAHMREAAFHRHAGDVRARPRIGEPHLRERKPDHGEVVGQFYLHLIVKDVLQRARRTSGRGGDVPEADLFADASQRIDIGASYGGGARLFMAARRRRGAQRLGETRDEMIANGFGLEARGGGDPRIRAVAACDVPQVAHEGAKARERAHAPHVPELVKAFLRGGLFQRARQRILAATEEEPDAGAIFRAPDVRRRQKRRERMRPQPHAGALQRHRRAQRHEDATIAVGAAPHRIGIRPRDDDAQAAELQRMRLRAPVPAARFKAMRAGLATRQGVKVIRRGHMSSPGERRSCLFVQDPSRNDRENARKIISWTRDPGKYIPPFA